MKKFRLNIDRYLEKLDEQWRAMPVRKQHRYALYFLAAYLLLIAGVIFKFRSDTPKSGNSMVNDHIENPIQKSKRPAIPQDSLPIILKNNNYERK